MAKALWLTLGQRPNTLKGSTTLAPARQRGLDKKDDKTSSIYAASKPAANLNSFWLKRPPLVEGTGTGGVWEQPWIGNGYF